MIFIFWEANGKDCRKNAEPRQFASNCGQWRRIKDRYGGGWGLFDIKGNRRIVLYCVELCDVKLWDLYLAAFALFRNAADFFCCPFLYQSLLILITILTQDKIIVKMVISISLFIAIFFIKSNILEKYTTGQRSFCTVFTKRFKIKDFLKKSVTKTGF